MSMNATARARGAALALGFALLCACGRHQPRQAASPLLDAFAVAYGQPAPYATVDDSGDHVTYRPQSLVDVAPGVVALISKSEIPGGCKACGGALSVHYLKHDASGYSRVGAWPDIGGKGEWGRALAWTMRTDIDDGPTMVTTKVEKDPACSATLQELITLTPRGPVKIATVIVATAFGPDPDGRPGDHVAGTVTPIVRGQRFAVQLSGSASVRQVYSRQGDVFTTYDSGAAGC
jgi:hypothetical protein